MAISWSNAQRTDGFVPSHIVEELCGTSAIAAVLTHAKLWHRCAKGYRIHDFLVFNTSRADQEERSRQRSEAGKVGAAKRWHTDGTVPSDRMAPAIDQLWQTDGKRMRSDAPVPSRPLPVPDSLDVAAAGTGETRPRDGTWFDPAPRPGVEKAGDTLARVVGRRASSGGSDSR
jgi:hypothetical protein